MLADLLWMNAMWAWGALAAVGLPILAHLLSRLTGRTITFPTIRFLQQAADEGRRRTRLRDWLLLLLRCLALGLVVAAFARPVWRVRGPADVGQGVDRILIVDRSASMSRAQDGASLFEEARAQALKALQKELNPQTDVATVILLDGRPRTLLPEPSANFSYLARQLATTSVSQERGDLSAALELAVAQGRLGEELARADPGRPVRRTVIDLYSDMQATQAAQIKNLPWPLYRHVLGQAQDNAGLFRPQLTPAHPVVGQPATAAVEVSYWSPHSESTRQVTVTMTAAGHSTSQTVMLLANTTATLHFNFTPGKPGGAMWGSTWPVRPMPCPWMIARGCSLMLRPGGACCW